MPHRSQPHNLLLELTYPANLLTLVRLALVPLIARELRMLSHRKAIALLGAAFFTDVIDGPIARSRGEVSELGKILDPISDKALLNVTAQALAAHYGLPRWIAGMLLARDCAILVGSAALFRRRSTIEMSQPIGKWTTVAFGVAFLLHLTRGQQWSRPALRVATALLIVSMLAYGRTYFQSLHAGD